VIIVIGTGKKSFNHSLKIYFVVPFCILDLPFVCKYYSYSVFEKDHLLIPIDLILFCRLTNLLCVSYAVRTALMAELDGVFTFYSIFY